MRFFFLYIVCLFLVISCASNPELEQNTAAEESTWVQLSADQIQKARIIVSPPKMELISTPLIVHGRVMAQPEAIQSVTFPLRARVSSIFVKLGEVVRKGQTLLVVEDLGIIELQQNYLTTVSELQFAKQELERQQEMGANNATSKRNEQQAQSNFDRLTALMRAYQEQLAMIGINTSGLTANSIRKSVIIIAPMNGVVTALNVSKGAFFESNQQLIDLLDSKMTETHVQVFQSDLQYIAINDKAYASVGGQELKGKVVRIVPSLDKNNSATVIVEWNNSANLYVGIGFKLEIEQKEVELMTVPVEAVLSWNLKNYVFVQRDAEKFELIEVEKVKENGKSIGIRGDLQITDEVVIKNAYTLLMAMKNKEEE